MNEDNVLCTVISRLESFGHDYVKPMSKKVTENRYNYGEYDGKMKSKY